MASIFNPNVRQIQQRSNKQAGSDKALRAALRQQRRNQAKQNSDTLPEVDEKKKYEKDTKESVDGEVINSRERKEKKDSKKKSKGPYYLKCYHACNEILNLKQGSLKFHSNAYKSMNLCE